MKYKTTRLDQGRHPPLDMRRRFDTVNSYHLQEHEAKVANTDTDDFTEEEEEARSVGGPKGGKCS